MSAELLELNMSFPIFKFLQKKNNKTDCAGKSKICIKTKDKYLHPTKVIVDGDWERGYIDSLFVCLLSEPLRR